MKLNEMSSKTKYKNMNKIFESRFGFTVDFNSMSLTKARKIINALTEGINKIRTSPQFHKSEKNPQYMELVMVRESMKEWLSERTRILKEGEIGQAEVILAARDIVDSLQKMVETLGKIQNEQMPAISDAIRDQIGSEQAEMFRNTVGPLLVGMAEQLMQAREGTDSAVRQLTGEEAPANDMDLSGGDQGGEMPAEPGAEMGAEMGGDTPALPAEPELPQPDDELSAGRARR